MPSLTVFDLATADLPISATPVTLTTRPDRWGDGQPVLHAQHPTCGALDATALAGGGSRPPRERMLGTGPLAEIAATLRSPGITLETVTHCARCDDPTFRAHLRELDDVAVSTRNWRTLRFELFRTTRDPHMRNLGRLATHLVAVAHDATTATTAEVEGFLRAQLADAHSQARHLREHIHPRERSPQAVNDGPWVAVGITDLAHAWKVDRAVTHLAHAPGNVFDHPVADTHFAGTHARAVVAMPAHLASIWAQEHPGLVEVTDVPLAVDQLEHLKLMTRLWVQHRHLSLADVVQAACDITAPVSR